MNNKQKSAFTLAEVLITLAIIGVVAAMTVPVLIQRTQDQQLKTAWKRSYSDLAQIFGQIIIQEGDLSGVCTHDAPFKDRFMEYVIPINGCGVANTKSCFWTGTTPTFNYKSFSGASVNLSLFDDGQIIMNNGTFVMFENAYGSPIPVCVAWVDVNGYKKGPNQLGFDVFGAQFLKDKIVPMGSPDAIDYGGCDKTDPSSMSGAGCASYILKNQDY